MKNVSTLPIPARTNLWLVGGIVALHILLLAGLPFLLAQSWWWALLIPATAWANATQWALIHEAIHKLLNPDIDTNERLGRLLSVLMGTSLHLLRFGHLMHHQLNRDWHSEWVKEKNLSARIGYYFHLLFGLYGEEVLTSSLLAVLPRETSLRLARRTAFKRFPEMTAGGERFFYIRGNIRPLRQDMAMVALLYGAAFWHFGAYWPALLGFIATRALVVSFLDNIYHYATPADNSKTGKELELSDFFSHAVLHGNYHETHHLNPNVPWTSLPQTHAEQGRIFNGPFAEHAIRQFHGPLINYA
jgi:fatty acid desaturase